MAYQRRDYYWKREGWRWSIWTAFGDEHIRINGLWFWWWSTAAKVTNRIFEAYHSGRDAERIESIRRLHALERAAFWMDSEHARGWWAQNAVFKKDLETVRAALPQDKRR